MTVQASHRRLAKQAEGARPVGAHSLLTLAIENMHCGGCMRSVERAALGVPGVETARASLAAKRLSVTYDASLAGEVDLIAALERAGFAAAPIEAAKQDRETARQNYLLRRVAVAGFAAMNIMLLSVAVWSGTASDMEAPLAALFRWLSALIALPTVAYAGQPFFVSALGALKGRRLNMDVPISLAILLGDRDEPLSDHARQRAGLFRCGRVAAVLPPGRPLSRRVVARARQERGAEPAQPAKRHCHAASRRTARAAWLPAHALRPGDRLLVAAGERVAADGVVLDGKGQIDQSLITGETAPVTVTRWRRDLCRHAQSDPAARRSRCTAADSATLLAEIGRLMLAAEQGKARYRRLADRAAQIYAPAVHGLGASDLPRLAGWWARRGRRR